MVKPTSVRLDNDLSKRLDALAVAVKRPKTWLIEEAVRRYVEEQSWQVQVIQEALDDYRSGNAELVEHTQVMQRLEAKIKAKSSA
jgi:RHH-type transcriptional regulator, rel operon repressor / antitoxin RelB